METEKINEQVSEEKPNVFDKIKKENDSKPVETVEQPTNSEAEPEKSKPEIITKKFSVDDANKTSRTEVEEQMRTNGVKKILCDEEYKEGVYECVACEFGPLYFNDFKTGQPTPPTKSRTSDTEYRTLRLIVKSKLVGAGEDVEILKESYPNVFVFFNKDNGEWDKLSIRDYNTKDIKALETDTFTSTVGLIKAKCCLALGKEPKDVPDFDFLKMMVGMKYKLVKNEGPISSPWTRPRNDILQFVK